ncbi:hypothetical protein J2Z70_000057 [Paenibacillus silagei]|uniref:Uncharacterized protein n=1 Tax=Paenibacillus silagei TaxID=1670801 RepID=A0ABS4NIQ5_9BACL|nr:hypothetical protein [Paenibacillus silagei]
MGLWEAGYSHSVHITDGELMGRRIEIQVLYANNLWIWGELLSLWQKQVEKRILISQFLMFPGY